MNNSSEKIVRRKLIIAAMLVAALGMLVGRAAAEPVELKVMSFNVRYSLGKPHEAAPENDWTDPQHPRRERAIRVIRENLPDVLGVQEAVELQVVDLREALPDFEFYGVGRDDGKAGGEYAGIFYRKDRFSREDAGSFWLSATPEKPATTFATEPRAVPRMASWVRLADNQSGHEMLVLNTHWDHISVPARRASATLIRERLAELGENIPAIVMGDLNAPEDSPEVTELIGGDDPQGRRLVDSYRVIFPKRSPHEATFNHWRGMMRGSRIDFILHTEDFTPTAAAIVRTSYDGHWPSDHYPVTATLRLESTSQ